ncbi:MAG: hypothetical protein HQL74_11130 [Magnetococcales bacterium]|nr:hypothetical protein [Magnetococcales bacterium]
MKMKVFAALLMIAMLGFSSQPLVGEAWAGNHHRSSCAGCGCSSKADRAYSKCMKKTHGKSHACREKRISVKNHCCRACSHRSHR